jgi:hypothetical protein
LIEPPARLRKGDAELLVHRQEVPFGLGDQSAPQGERLLVAALQGHHPQPGPGAELLVGVEPCPCGLVEVGRVVAGGGGFVQVLDQHAEGGTPVTEVVGPAHVVAEELEQPRRGVADDRRPQVAGVHLLGRVGRGVVDHDGLRPRRPRRLDRAGHEGGDQRVVDGEVDEARAGDGRGGQPVQRGAGDDVRGDLPWRAPQRTGQPQGGIALEVGTLRAPDHRIHGMPGDRLIGGRQPVGQLRFEIQELGFEIHRTTSSGWIDGSPRRETRRRKTCVSADGAGSRGVGC